MAAAVAAAAIAAAPAVVADGRVGAPTRPGPADTEGFAGTRSCAGCHAAEAEAWRGSQHDLAMQPATPQTVLGDFGGASLTHFGATTTFFRDGERFVVRTEDVDGVVRDFRVDYVFGIDPLQQLLIGRPDGRLQAFGIAWDARPREAGGQRWFHLYPDEPVAAGDPLHWMGRNQTWNWMCADCHSTGLRRGYDPVSDSYRTTWSEVDVGCEACHGPGADHVAWAEAGADRAADPSAGLTVDIMRGGVWRMDNPARGIAGLAEADTRAGAAQVETCAACHARRRPLAELHRAGTPLLDDYVPALLDEGLYHADGQILDEVYVWGSFVQSAMHRAGVVCADCHEPHTAALRAEGNALCSQCHLPALFDTPDHHHHTAGGTASRCVACHMPAQTYMVVDPRRDHSFRVPRPDLAAAVNAPDVCTGCHEDRDPAWATSVLKDWFGEERWRQPHFAAVLHAGRTGAPDAWNQLAALATDSEQAAIVRATALSLLPRYTPWLNPAMVRAINEGLEDDDSQVRLAATEALSGWPLEQTAPSLLARLEDTVRAVRIEAARQLAALPLDQVPRSAAFALDRATAELEASLAASAERPESLVNLGDLETARRHWHAAEAAYRRAMLLDPGYLPAHANLADLLRSRGNEEAAEALLRKALAMAPDAAGLHHALGLSLARSHRYDAALAELRQAWELAPDNAAFGYVYAVALESTGSPGQSVEVLSSVVARHPSDRPAREALIQALVRQGQTDAARRQASALAAMAPDDPRLRDLVRALDRTSAE